MKENRDRSKMDWFKIFSLIFFVHFSHCTLVLHDFSHIFMPTRTLLPHQFRLPPPLLHLRQWIAKRSLWIDILCYLHARRNHCTIPITTKRKMVRKKSMHRVSIKRISSADATTITSFAPRPLHYSWRQFAPLHACPFSSAFCSIPIYAMLRTCNLLCGGFQSTPVGSCKTYISRALLVMLRTRALWLPYMHNIKST